MNTANLPKAVGTAKDTTSLTTQKSTSVSSKGITLGSTNAKPALQEKVSTTNKTVAVSESNSNETVTKTTATVANKIGSRTQGDDGFSMELLRPGQGHHIIIAPTKDSTESLGSKQLDKSKSPTQAQGHSPRLRLSRKKSPRTDTLKAETTIPQHSAKQSLKRKSDAGLDCENSSKRPRESDSSLKSHSLQSSSSATDNSMDHSISVNSCSSSKMLTRSMDKSLSQESATYSSTTESQKEGVCSKLKPTGNSKLAQPSLPKGKYKCNCNIVDKSLTKAWFLLYILSC